MRNHKKRKFPHHCPRCLQTQWFKWDAGRGKFQCQNRSCEGVLYAVAEGIEQQDR